MAKSIWVVNFEKHNPPKKIQHSDARGKPLKWVRCMTNWFDDVAVLTMPEEQRGVWSMVFALAGESTPPGRIDMTPGELAVRLRMREETVAAALTHLWKKGRIRYTRPVAEKSPEGGGEVA